MDAFPLAYVYYWPHNPTTHDPAPRCRTSRYNGEARPGSKAVSSEIVKNWPPRVPGGPKLGLPAPSRSRVNACYIQHMCTRAKYHAGVLLRRQEDRAGSAP